MAGIIHPRLAQEGLGSPPPPWVSQLAEELAALVSAGIDPGTLSRRIREECRARSISDPWVVTQLVAREWDRMGIVRVPRGAGAGGW